MAYVAESTFSWQKWLISEMYSWWISIISYLLFLIGKRRVGITPQNCNNRVVGRSIIKFKRRLEEARAVMRKKQKVVRWFNTSMSWLITQNIDFENKIWAWICFKRSYMIIIEHELWNGSKVIFISYIFARARICARAKIQTRARAVRARSLRARNRPSGFSYIK